MTNIIWFDDKKAHMTELTGGKGANLGLMTRAGLPVPPGFVVSTNCYTSFIEHSGLLDKLFSILDGIDYADIGGLEAVSESLGSLIRNAEMPAALAQEIIAAYHQLGAENYVAVRSSGTAEDMEGASFAGLHDTYLDIIGETVLISAVKDCWASMWSARAISYRHVKKFDHRQIAIAVVIQQMVESEVSGVMFTANPLEGRSDEMVVNASWGLGESIVSGIVNPDEYTLCAHTLEVRKRITGDKTLKIVRADPPKVGTVSVPTTPDEAASLCLDDSTLQALCEVGRNIMLYYDGLPQDIEWAYAEGQFYVLQSRPVTGVDFVWEECLEYASNNLPEKEGTIWTLRWAEAYWTGGISPLHYSVRNRHYRKSVEYVLDFAGFEDLKGVPFFKYHKGTVYWNCDFQKKFTQLIAPRYARAAGIDMLPTAWREEAQNMPLDFPRYLRMLMTINSSSMHSFSNFIKTQRHWIDDKVEEATALPEEQLRKMSDESLRRYINNQVELMHEYCNNLWMGYNVLLPTIQGLFTEIIKRFYRGDNKMIAQDLTTGLPVQSLQSKETHEFFALAKLIKSLPSVLACFNTSSAETFFDRVKEVEGGEDFLEHYKVFIDNHGHRGAAERDIVYLRRADCSAIDYHGLSVYLNNSDFTPIDEVESRMIEKRVQATQEVLADLEQVPFASLLVPVFRILHQWVLDFLLIREDSRHYADRISYSKRRAFLEVGRRCAERGRLASADDCFFLTDLELYEVLSGGCSLPLVRAKIAGRKKYFDKINDRTASLPLYLRGRVPVDLDDDSEVSDSGSLVGQGMSGGDAVGRARVVPDVSLIGKVEKGDILICNATDPAWASVFSLIDGLVIETGGMLAHGACLSREHGIPAVQLRNAMQIIPDGATVHIKGETGELVVVE